MKKILILVVIFISNVAGAQTILANGPVIKAAAPTPVDTLAWLQANIIQKSSYYIGKPFSVLMDTIQAHGMNIYNMDYLRALTSDGSPSEALFLVEDTVWTKEFSFFFKPFYSGTYSNMHDQNSNINTNVPYIGLSFTQKIPFPAALSSVYTVGYILGPVLNIVRPYVISSIQLKTW